MAFQLDPESAHQRTLSWLHRFPQLATLFAHPSLDNEDKYQIRVGNLTWPFPVGLAAGLDKEALAIPFFSRLLLGAIEVGTVTPLAQSGNPKPRLFRLAKEESLRNQMGFNNQGMEDIFYHIVRSPTARCLGVNLGKNRATPPEDAAQDYFKLYQKFAPIADYLVINVSSPNTSGLRKLQEKGELEKILAALAPARHRHPCPLWVKISPDMDLTDTDNIAQLAHTYKLTGLIATNTTVIKERGEGGVSGKLLYPRAKELRSHLLKTLKQYPELHLIGVGGFSSFDEIADYWREGGSAVQVYTALIYQGPKFLLEVKKGIDHMLKEAGVRTLQDWFKSLS